MSIQYTVSKHNEQNGSYDPVHTSTITEELAKEMESFFVSCLNVEGFYYHQFNFPDGRMACKYSSFLDVLGIVTAKQKSIYMNKEDIEKKRSLNFTGHNSPIISGAELIALERKEQIEKHKRTVQHDVSYNHSSQLTHAAAHLINGGELGNYTEADMELVPIGWSESIYRKMLLKPYKQRLIIAGALIAAEIDRVQQYELKKKN